MASTLASHPAGPGGLLPASAHAAPIGRWRQIALPSLAAGAAWALASISAAAFEDVGDWSETGTWVIGTGVLAALLVLGALLSPWLPRLGQFLARRAPWLIVSGLFLTVWQLTAAKLGWLPQPFFPPPQALLEVLVWEWDELLKHLWASLQLVTVGFALGALAGFVLGVAIGWSTHIGYWVHPVLRFIGPLPATALLPIVFLAFPTSWSASIFLIALAAGFPVAILTWSGVANVDQALYDVARTQGLGNWGLITKVAIPAALPNVFVGLFMALGAAFSALMVAELIGVKAGMAFYIQWSQGWAAYANVWTTILVLALVCSGSITLLFKIRDHWLSWQKGLVKW
ncbi:ABC transporter permease subunit [Corticibacter populi]|uniref:ABC transporter permease subunit n=1 Tax=Corticibacter populi TaxID=1550736 RepID=A0A3M6QXK5_9BURK|nr:ABC transporter permease subunit [Corticibacter populi]RMX07738.1 ABC transporter permease subunit [Corticibacter populi]RZS34956.1 NitT/TauT family transport system permease protein [Corticibacter populi]